MSRLILTASLLAVLAIAACSPAAGGPSAVPSVPPIPSAPPTVEPPASDPSVDPAPSPTDEPAIPAPDPTDPPETPDPAIVEFTEGEIFLADGILRGVMDCEPVRAKLPKDAVAGIECLGKDSFVARVGYYLFENDEEMLDHYFARLASEGVERDMGDCYNNEGEGPYVPGEEEVASRYGCFITAEGVANYRMTLPGAHVYIGIVGRAGDPVELVDFAFKGSRDTPSSPTLWGTPNS